MLQEDEFSTVGRREAAVLYAMKHPHIVQLLGIVTNNSQPFGFMMEYVSEETLEDVIYGDR